MDRPFFKTGEYFVIKYLTKLFLFIYGVVMKKRVSSEKRGMSSGHPVLSCDVSQGLEKKFIKYVSQNILAMLGISAYILADTFFISWGEGADGITALNLVLPVYSLIFAVGSMIAVGSAIKFSILRARGELRADEYFTNAVFFTFLFSLAFIAVGILAPDKLVELLGGEGRIVAVGTPYTRIFLMFAPFFMWNYVWCAFIRNDGNPSLVMTATLVSNFFNIVMDYVLMFPMGLGMAGAALATAVSPVLSIAVCSIHFLSGRNTIKIRWKRPSLKKLAEACRLGVSSFVGELSSGVTTMIFNFLILGLAGNEGVAAYGIVANVAIVVTSIFNGIAQGAQPLISDFYGKNEKSSVRRVLHLSVETSAALAVLMVVAVNLFAEIIVNVFNSEQNMQLTAYAMEGIRLYFIGFLFAGFNIVGTGYLSATENAGWAFVTSILRGVVAISVCALVMAALFGMTGVWLAFAAAELITAAVMAAAVGRSRSS